MAWTARVSPRTRLVLLGAAVAVAGLVVAAWPRGGPRRAPPGAVERLLTPAPAPLPAAALAAAEARVRERVGVSFPGAVLALGNRDLIQRVTPMGHAHWADDAPPVDARATRYDLASLTKVVATTAAVMALVEDGRMELDAPVRRYLPEFRGAAKDSVTVRQLLTHTSGTRAGIVDIQGETRAQVLRFVLAQPLALSPGQDVLYSDVGFVVLWAAAERAAGEPLPRYLRRRVWGPLGMVSTSMAVPAGCGPCAPSLHLQEAGEPYRGGSYDELARRMDGEAGHAGAFATGHDLARFAAAIANEGRLGDVRVFRRRTVRSFTRPQPGTGTRALGWEVYCREGVVPDHQTCERLLAFGHTGSTGTSLWIDPRSRSWVVLLTNRSYLPRDEIDMQRFRRQVFAAAVPDTAPR